MDGWIMELDSHLMLSVMLLGADVSMAAVGQRIKKQTHKRMSAQVLLKPWYLCEKKKWAIGQIILMYIMLAMDPTFSWVDLFVVRHHVVSHNGLCQLARGLRTESCEGQNRENHKIQWERLNYPTSFSSFFTDLRLILEVCLLMPVPLLSRDDWLPGERKMKPIQVSVSSIK